jgi:hypothetical protein
VLQIKKLEVIGWVTINKERNVLKNQTKQSWGDWSRSEIKDKCGSALAY